MLMDRQRGPMRQPQALGNDGNLRQAYVLQPHGQVPLPVGTAVTVLIDQVCDSADLCWPTHQKGHQSMCDCTNTEEVGFS